MNLGQSGTLWPEFHLPRQDLSTSLSFELSLWNVPFPLDACMKRVVTPTCYSRSEPATPRSTFCLDLSFFYLSASSILRTMMLFIVPKFCLGCYIYRANNIIHFTRNFFWSLTLSDWLVIGWCCLVILFGGKIGVNCLQYFVSHRLQRHQKSILIEFVWLA